MSKKFYYICETETNLGQLFIGTIRIFKEVVRESAQRSCYLGCTVR